MTHAVESDIGAARRQSGGVNQDSVSVVPLTLTVDGTEHTAEIVAVADGAGGHDAGEVASYLAVSRVAEQLVEAVATPTAHERSSLEGRIDVPFRTTPTDVEADIEAAIEAANEKILSFCSEERVEAHATISVGVRVGGRFHYGWVGDSPIYLLNRQHDRIEQLTHDHSRVQADVDDGDIDEVAALVHPDSNELRRALGGSKYDDAENRTIDVETATVELFAEDVIVVASDGLVDAHAVGSRPDELYEAYQEAEAGSRREEEIAAEIREFAVTTADIRSAVLDVPELNRAATNLIEMANGYGGKDNVTVVLFQWADLQSTPERYPIRGWKTEALSSQSTVVEESNGAVEAVGGSRGETSEPNPRSDATSVSRSESGPKAESAARTGGGSRDDRENGTRQDESLPTRVYRWLFE